MHPERVITIESLYELHKEWNDLIAARDAIRARPHDDHAEQALIARLEEHREKLQSMREALLRQFDAVSHAHPRRRTDFVAARK
jgi:hypothetical protein